MDLIIQSEYYRELFGQPGNARDVDADAAEAERGEEKVYEYSRLICLSSTLTAAELDGII